MKTAIALNDRILELFEIEENNSDEDYYPKVIQIAEIDDYISLHQSAWPISTEYNRKVFIAPDKLWEEVNKCFIDIENFIIEAIKVAPNDFTSKCYIFKCDNGYMFWGPFNKNEDNWITYIDKSRNIIVGRHHRKDNRQQEINEGLEDGNVIPIAENYFDFILRSVATRIRTMRSVITKLFNPYN